jgi:amino acid permease
MPGYPYTSWIALISIIIIILSMPFISGQSSGLIAGVIMIAFYSVIYYVFKFIRNAQRSNDGDRRLKIKKYRAGLSAEFSKELNEDIKKYHKNKTDRKKF